MRKLVLYPLAAALSIVGFVAPSRGQGNPYADDAAVRAQRFRRGANPHLCVQPNRWDGGTLENAQAMAAHESPRTTKLYDRPT
jgi:hypothetical protein